jgi:SAM-dependent methyltransferase
MTSKEKFEFIKGVMFHQPVVNAAVFSVLRSLKKLNPGDSYYENYLWHYKKRGNTFVDYYHLLWQMAANCPPASVLEIGCRTGISICQLLSAMEKPQDVKVVLCDIFADGFISPEIVKMNLRHLNLPTENIEFKVGSSLDIIPTIQEKFDYILVDGDHTPSVARQDLENVSGLLNEGGILITDDIAADGCDLIGVWNDFKDKHNQEFLFVPDNFDGKGVGCAVRL